MKQKTQMFIERNNSLGQTIKIWYTNRYGDIGHNIISINGVKISSGLSFEFEQNALLHSESKEIQDLLKINKQKYSI
jgi:hypothetical protein